MLIGFCLILYSKALGTFVAYNLHMFITLLRIITDVCFCLHVQVKVQLS